MRRSKINLYHYLYISFIGLKKRVFVSPDDNNDKSYKTFQFVSLKINIFILCGSVITRENV